MKLTRKGDVVKGSTLYEVEAKRSDTYHDLLKNISSTLNMKPKDPLKYELQLYKLNGVTISSWPPTEDKGKQWTLGSYLQKIKKSPTQLKIGIGYSIKLDSDVSFVFVYMYYYCT